MENSFGLMEKFIKGSGKWANNMEQDNLLVTVYHSMESGVMEKEFLGSIKMNKGKIQLLKSEMKI